VELVRESFFLTEFDLLIKNFEAFCNNNHIWYTSPGLSPSQALGFGKPSIWAWLRILKAQTH
jgi:hypothetical protein